MVIRNLLMRAVRADTCNQKAPMTVSRHMERGGVQAHGVLFISLNRAM
jgi:hypothetical protein